MLDPVTGWHEMSCIILSNNNNNNNLSVFYSAFLSTQRRFTNKKGIHTDSTDTQTKGKK